MKEVRAVQIEDKEGHAVVVLMFDVWVEMLYIADSVTASVGPMFLLLLIKSFMVIYCCITNSHPNIAA